MQFEPIPRPIRTAAVVGLAVAPGAAFHSSSPSQFAEPNGRGIVRPGLAGVRYGSEVVRETPGAGRAGRRARLSDAPQWSALHDAAPARRGRSRIRESAPRAAGSELAVARRQTDASVGRPAEHSAAQAVHQTAGKHLSRRQAAAQAGGTCVTYKCDGPPTDPAAQGREGSVDR